MLWSVRMTVVDVGQVLVTVAEHQMSMMGTVEQLDGARAVMWVIRINRMSVLSKVMRVEVRVVRGRDHHDADQ